MPNFTLNGAYPALGKDGPPYAMALLLKCRDSGERFLTYDAIAKELEHQWGVPKIPALRIGYVAGSLMDAILEIDKESPLINLMITSKTGMPGDGVSGYVKNRYNKNWLKLSDTKKKRLVEREWVKISKYDWDKINKKIKIRFGTKNKPANPKLRNLKLNEIAGFSPDGKNHGGAGESKEHKKLKKWVAKNPAKIGLRTSYGEGKLEAPLLSGDSVDVLFSDGDDFVTVEVKSCRSNDDDFRRGIYQCVKYRKVKQAEQEPYKVKVKAILVTERKLNPNLKERAKLLKVITKCVLVNKKESTQKRGRVKKHIKSM